MSNPIHTDRAYGVCWEPTRTYKPDGPMCYPVAEIRPIGPFVRAREVRDDGTRGPWQTIAIALDPIRYIRALAGANDIVPREI